MILVIADDLTGAAEIAGIGLRYGLKVRVCTEIIQEVTEDILVNSPDTHGPAWTTSSLEMRMLHRQNATM
ncbi:hypothetical protein [Flectobacillus roseus]|uniref:hypothetical protein n=1 Tax=Flectobacillus roseus TaxID=502259 RepID=UPI0024B6AABF|nr:hypothetical protein [Flectobacillus roseus]MDI9872315.1 hypothetical protein [Flectobacillus roseus]